VIIVKNRKKGYAAAKARIGVRAERSCFFRKGSPAHNPGSF